MPQLLHLVHTLWQQQGHVFRCNRGSAGALLTTRRVSHGAWGDNETRLGHGAPQRRAGHGMKRLTWPAPDAGLNEAA